MLRTIAWYTNFALSLILYTPKMYKVKKDLKKGNIKDEYEYIDNITSKWAFSQLKLSGARVKIFGEENIPKDIPVVFISNHQGNFDIALFMSLIKKPKGYIAKAEMEKVPLLRTWMRYMHCVFMDRSNLRKSAQSIIEGVKILKNGQSLVIFPEGTRSKGDKLGEFKAGSFKLATKAKVPIIPITINGSYKILEAHKGKIVPSDVEIYIHPMIETKNLTREEQELLPEKVRSIIASKLPNQGI